MANVQFIQITPEELRESILNGIKFQLDALKKEFQPKEPEELLTRSEAADMLKVNISTIHNYSKKGILKRYGIGNRVYYKRREIEKALIELG